jgi:CubicO group peptidase (beta-lactamase class C family)
MMTTSSTMSRELVDAESVGVDPARLDLLLRRVEHEVEVGPLPSCQVAVAKHGRLVADATFGDSTPELRYILQSVSRPVIAGIVWKLIGEKLLDVSERVCDIIGEFGSNGKDVVTVEQLLTHTGGFPLAPLGYPKMTSRAQRLEAFAKWRLTYPPGDHLEFHLTSAAWVIGEIVERRTGVALPDYLRAEIAEPLGLTIELGVPIDRQRETIAWPVAYDRTSDDQEVDPWGPWYPVVNPEILAAGEPSHSMVGTAADCALFYQAMYHSGLWHREVVEECSRARIRMLPGGMYGGDRMIHLGLFVTVVGDDAGGSWMPHTGSPATFGHGGAPSQLSFYDPSTGLSFAFLHNGYPVAGYDNTQAGKNLIFIVGDLAGDLAR